MSIPTTVTTKTHFSILTFPTTFQSHSHSLSLYNRCSFQSLSLSCEFLGKTSNFRRSKGMRMGERVIKIPPLRAGDVEEHVSVLEQESLVGGPPSQSPSSLLSFGFESLLNHLSKWLVGGLFGAIILWRHDTEALWAAMGSVLNSGLSVILKRLLNQERPHSNRRSDPGMPSSHAQSIFFAVVFMVLSMVEWQGVNELTVIFSTASLVFGAYLSWLRVSQRFHTISQVVVGSALGFCFALLWFWSWDSLVSDAFNSFFWVRVSVFLGSGICCLGFLAYVVLNWFTEEQ